MRFSLVGSHPDGLGMACALAASGRHALASYTGSADGKEYLRRAGLQPAWVRDFEEVLADPLIDAVIVASELEKRPDHLRRALQSERHVLCVCPVDRTPDIAYEAAMIQKDTGRLLFPLLPDAAHPAIVRLAQLIENKSAIGTLPLLQAEMPLRFTRSDVAEKSDAKLPLPGWDILSALGGEIIEVSGFASASQIKLDEPLLLAGRFRGDGIFQVTFLPDASESFVQFSVCGNAGRAELAFPKGLFGPAILVFENAAGSPSKEAWEAWDRWPRVVQLFEAALPDTRSRTSESPSRTGRTAGGSAGIDWQTAIRCLELDDAARRSVERRRSSILEYPEASEEVGFKGTMTLLGCGLLWLVLLALVLSRWEPRVGWIIIPILVGFLGLQLLRWIVPKSGK